MSRKDRQPVQPEPWAPRMSPGVWILHIVQGMLIGSGAILPGISGGMLAVAFGVYQPMMALLAHPKINLPRLWRLFLPIAIGWAAGFLLLAGVIEKMYAANQVLTIWLFIGMIAGTLPDLYRVAGERGRSRGGWIAFAVSFALLFFFLYYVQYHISAQITPNVWWFLFCGALWGLSVVVPGLSSSSLEISLGLFYPLLLGFISFDLTVLTPVVIGIIAVLLLMARLVNALFNRYYTVAYHIVFGVVIAATIVIIPLHYSSVTQALLSLLCAAGGCGGALLMTRYGKKINEREAARRQAETAASAAADESSR